MCAGAWYGAFVGAPVARSRRSRSLRSRLPEGRGYAPLPSDSYPRQAELAGCLFLRASHACALRAVFCAGARSRTPCALRSVFVLSQADVSALRAAAEAGDAGAQCRLGVLYARGEGVARDAAEGARWLRKAAEQGYADAQYDLGLLYARGQGVETDAAEAVFWFYKAGDQGHKRALEALRNLGELY